MASETLRFEKALGPKRGRSVGCQLNNAKSELSANVAGIAGCRFVSREVQHTARSFPP